MNGVSYRSLFSAREILAAEMAIGAMRRRYLCLRLEEYDDILQECLLHWIAVKPSFDPSKGVLLATFMNRVLTNKMHSMARLLSAEKRRAFSTSAPLDEMPEPGGGDDYSGMELRIDVSAAMSGLSRRQRKLCALIGGEGLNIAQAGRRLKTPRTTLYTDLRHIKDIFTRANLGVYMNIREP